MGGYGSGRHLSNPMRAVEDGLTLRIRVFSEAFRATKASNQPEGGTGTWRGTLTWSRGDRTTAQAGTVVRWADGAPRVTLAYTWTPAGGEPRDVRQLVETKVTEAGFGGVRRWFACPGLGGRACGRRVGCLYLPPGSGTFACRTCHRLTYRSRQESRKYDALFRHLAGQVGADPRDVRGLLAR